METNGIYPAAPCEGAEIPIPPPTELMRSWGGIWVCFLNQKAEYGTKSDLMVNFGTGLVQVISSWSQAEWRCQLRLDLPQI